MHARPFAYGCTLDYVSVFVCACACACARAGVYLYLSTVNEQTLMAVLLVSSVNEGSSGRNTAEGSNPTMEAHPSPINS